jgi:hypothetical protein
MRDPSAPARTVPMVDNQGALWPPKSSRAAIRLDTADMLRKTIAVTLTETLTAPPCSSVRRPA